MGRRHGCGYRLRGLLSLTENLVARFKPDYREELRLANRVTVQLRPVRPEDKALLEDGFERLSKESRYARFLTPRRGFTSLAGVR